MKHECRADTGLKRSARVSRLAVLCFCCLFLHTAWEKSPTWDEVGYIGLGAYLLKTGQWDVPASGSHPPLAFYINSLPSFLYPLDWALWHYSNSERDVRFLRMADTGRGNALLLDQRYDGEVFFFLTRATSLFFACVLFAVLLCWSREILPYPRNILPAFLCALSPNILAHAPLINTDFALTTTFICAVFALRALLYGPSMGRFLACGLALGLALLSKLSALVLLPIFALLIAHFYLFASDQQREAVDHFLSPLPLRPLPIRLALCFGAQCALAAFVLWIGYGFQILPYWQMVQSQLWDLQTGHSAYLMGEFSTRGWWHYFPVALLIKTPIVTLLLVAAGLFPLLFRRSLRLEMGFLLIAPLILLAGFVLGNSKNIGLRYILPIYPFMFLVSAYAEFPLRSRVRPWIAAALCGWYAFSSLSTHPHHLAYFNEAVGGPANGYRYMVDSNLDWGQDLKGLKRYMDERGIDSIKLSYFGTVDPRLYDLRYEWLPSFVLPNPDAQRQVVFPTDGLIAISATNLVGVYMDQYGHGKHLFSWLDQHQPIAHIGHSILIYDIPPQY